jgi:hypothetical protein
MLSTKEKNILKEARYLYSSKISDSTYGGGMFVTKFSNNIFLCKKPLSSGGLYFHYYDEEIKNFLLKNGFDFMVLMDKKKILECAEIFYEILILTPEEILIDNEFVSNALDIFPPAICFFANNKKIKILERSLDNVLDRFPCFYNLVSENYYISCELKKRFTDNTKYIFSTELLKYQVLKDPKGVIRDVEKYNSFLPGSFHDPIYLDEEVLLDRSLLSFLDIFDENLNSDHLSIFNVNIFDIKDMGLIDQISLKFFVHILFDSISVNRHVRRAQEFELEDFAQIFDYLYVNRDNLKNGHIFLEAMLILLDFERAITYNNYYSNIPPFLAKSKYIAYLVKEYNLRRESKYTRWTTYSATDLAEELNPFVQAHLENMPKRKNIISGFMRKELKRETSKIIKYILDNYSGYNKINTIRSTKTWLDNHCYHYFSRRLIGYAKHF